MSETLTAPQGGAEAEPAATTPEATAPVDAGAATETTPEPQPQEEQPKPSRADRRIAALSARLAAQQQEIEALRRQAAPPAEQDQPIAQEDMPRVIEERVAAEVAKRELQSRIDAFHRAGRAAHPDWNDRCQSLVQMGGDAPFSQLLVEMDDGARVAAALADDPEEMERIVGLKSDRARAIALGKFAATLEAKPVAPARRVTRAPEPPRPISGGSARVEIDEGTMTAQQLVDHYSRLATEARAQRTARN